MSALILPFPRVRDRRFIRRHAAHMATASTTTKAEAHLARQLKIQRETLQRRGVAEDGIRAELTAIEGNIRTACWTMLLAPGGAA
ncbi:hypothetical protein ASG32_26245 [Methylobacterium sp. Leaf361]|uniref:DUF6074 family protein n=1 Tax=Methylobacterium sp. Leaf361 TaxID=1736352 RepID=UPI0006F28F83|nr:DUF6074 family protein [Methylobacterium sp. Leaf361]KQS77544.1 hypothetical protein ASG32_26245 [Methylobacterium sp. Leaf361]